MILSLFTIIFVNINYKDKSMAKRKTWRSKLTKRELIHLKEDAGVNNLDGLRKNFSGQAETRIANPEIEPCWECKTIAQKLGFPV